MRAGVRLPEETWRDACAAYPRTDAARRGEPLGAKIVDPDGAAATAPGAFSWTPGTSGAPGRGPIDVLIAVRAIVVIAATVAAIPLTKTFVGAGRLSRNQAMA